MAKPSMQHAYAVIMAGGGGTRLWPLSRQSRPKQMLTLIEERSLFQIAVQRLQALLPPERILVVTSQQQADELKTHAPELPAENYILEPQPRGTAAAIGLAAAALGQRDPQAVMIVLTADHYIGNESGFHRYLEAAVELAQAGPLVTLGIEPTFAATQYGYIQMGASLGEFSGYVAHQVKRFKEKPNVEEAEAMLASGDHVWNSGMFIWTIERILQEFAEQMPDLHTTLQKVSAAWGTPQFDEVIAHEWPRIAAQTIDYGVMEHATNVAVIPAKELAWNDVGSWTSLFDVLPADANGNLALHPYHHDLDSHNSLIHGASNTPERLIVTVGVKDLVVVDTGDVLLICSRERAQDVRQVIEALKEKGLQRYL
ncbi:MAG: mannose-1-phosphate guanylyltransferase [Anaerolineales bacterium]|nr:mannose-1-phosphate guanylyltransferase [Anaerolineales bacterium]